MKYDLARNGSAEVDVSELKRRSKERAERSVNRTAGSDHRVDHIRVVGRAQVDDLAG